MRSIEAVPCGCLLLALLFGTAGPVGAEVICHEPENAGNQDCAYLLIAGITEEADPLTSAHSGFEGPSSGSGLPDAGFDDASPQIVIVNGVTIAVWAESDAGNSDIVFSEWGPGGWEEVRLTSGGSQEIEPRAAIAGNGEIYVTWWEPEQPRRIRVVRRDPVTLLWDQPEAFAGAYGARPSVLVLEDEVLLAFERQTRSGAQEVVVRRAARRPDGPVGAVEDVVASTYRLDTLGIELHLQGDRPFMDWIHRDGYFGYTEYQDGEWGVSLDSRPLTRRPGGPSVRRDISPIMH